MNKLQIVDRTVDAIFFYNPSDPHGYLSNWSFSPFKIDGVRFVSMEQYIMYEKCVVFGDQTSANAILATDDPATHKKIGRNAKGYVDSVWGGMRQLIALRGLLAKFMQNEELNQKLLSTGDAWLVESSHNDVVWACGRGLDEPERFDVAQWRGKNILGFAIMETRTILRAIEK